jgi:hypothetical protein
MGAKRTQPAGLINSGFQKITTNSTATLLNSTCQLGSAFLMSVETQSIRVVFDGSTTPAASTGVLLTAANSPYYFEGVDGTKLKLARAVAGAIVNVQAWRRA